VSYQPQGRHVRVPFARLRYFRGECLLESSTGTHTAGESQTMHLNPTSFDIWFMTKLAEQIAPHPNFDNLVLGAIKHNVLGGFWFALALFVYWLEGTRAGREMTRRRMLVTLLGTGLAIALSLLAGLAISWPPPSHHPQLAHFYSGYFEPNPNTSSFPSQSTTLYMAVAAGIFTENRIVGSILGLMVLFFVALPRAFVGGHYPSDILAGLVLGLAGTLSALYFLDRRLAPLVQKTFDVGWRRVVLETVVVVWILEIAVEFNDVVWLTNVVPQWFLH
jgi:membrane-associated phospholipid phosphatase